MKHSLKTLAAAITAAGLAASLAALPSLAAQKTDTPTTRETNNAALSRQAAAEGIVLLDNSGAALPIAKSGKIALFGVGAYATVKGGTGSGDVNNRYMITVDQGLTEAGYTITTNPTYSDAVKANYAAGLTGGGGFMGGGLNYASFEEVLTATTVAPTSATNTALYVLARNSGEGGDRSAGAGDYQLTDTELDNIELIGQSYDHVIVALNVGAVVDTTFFDVINEVASDPSGDLALDALVLASQGGQESGRALVDVLNGTVTPSGKTVDTWAYDYADYPASATFALADGDALNEIYAEGIYVGYRYFDSFDKPVNYPFGYGLSYTDFDIKPGTVTATATNVTVKATVTNIGKTYAGKEVVQVYYSAPQTGLDKPYQELAGFAKTNTLKPGESQEVTITFPTAQLASYDAAISANVIEAGDYAIRVGNSSRYTTISGVLQVATTTVVEQLSTQFADQTVTDLVSDPDDFIWYEEEAAEFAAAPKVAISLAGFTAPNHASALAQTVPVPANSTYFALDRDLMSTATAYLNAAQTDWEGTGSAYTPQLGETVENKTVTPGATLFDVYKGAVSLEAFVAGLSVEQLATIVEGTGMGGASAGSVLSANGAAGYTTAAYEALGIAPMTLSDGPAGLRITQHWNDGPGGTGGQDYYQFATDWPIGTMLAQTWNEALIEKVGEAIGVEMGEYGVTLWLAPGMNIHRDPLNGRNFEYFSEDPLLSGLVATAETKGVQATPGVGVTLKHYALNNQETQRQGSNSQVSERALREIYLKGFEIAVRSAQPMSVMSSYNKINGTDASGSYDLLTNVLRGEWGFAGTVMTDWTGNYNSARTLYSGNDLIEPGNGIDEVITSVKQVDPSFDKHGLPIHTSLHLSLGGPPIILSNTWMLGAAVLDATGSETWTKRVDNDAAVAGPTTSGVTSLDYGSGGGAPTFTPDGTFTTVDDAYNLTVTQIDPATDNGLTAAQKAAITLTVNAGGSGSPVTDYTVTIKGKWNNILRLGDLQRSVIRILKTITQSADFGHLAEVKGVSGIVIKPYTAQFTNLTNYNSVSLGAVKVPVVKPSPSVKPSSAAPKPTPTQSQTPINGPTPGPKSGKVVKVKFAQKTVTLVKGKSIKIAAAAYTDSGAKAKVTYKSNKTKIAKVTKSGKITAKKVGKAVITVKSGGKKATLKVTVVKAKKATKVTKVSAKGIPKSLTVGAVKYVTPKFTPKAAVAVKVRYSSTKKSVVSIDKVGRLVAKAKGTAKIKVKAGKVTKTYKVTVK